MPAVPPAGSARGSAGVLFKQQMFIDGHGPACRGGRTMAVVCPADGETFEQGPRWKGPGAASAPQSAAASC